MLENESNRFEQWFEQEYLPTALQLPQCADTWFPKALADYRAGNSEAESRILGSCLRIPAQILREQATILQELGVNLEDGLQRVNGFLRTALRKFEGDKADDFVCHAERFVRRRLQVIITRRREHPHGYEIL